MPHVGAVTGDSMPHVGAVTGDSMPHVGAVTGAQTTVGNCRHSVADTTDEKTAALVELLLPCRSRDF